MTNETIFKIGLRGKAFATCYRVLLVVMFSAIVGLSSVTAQQMGSQATYSDSWLDVSSPNAPVIVGCGVSQDYNNSYGHTYRVTTTITSPSGRTASATSYTGSYYARVEVTLPWDWNTPDEGTYAIDSQHTMCCPYLRQYGAGQPPGSGCVPSGGSSSPLPISLQKTAFRYEGGDGDYCYYNGTCSGRCNPGGTAYVIARTLYPGPCPSPFIQCEELYAGGVCFKDTRICHTILQEGECTQ